MYSEVEEMPLNIMVWGTSTANRRKQRKKELLARNLYTHFNNDNYSSIENKSGYVTLIAPWSE